MPRYFSGRRATPPVRLYFFILAALGTACGSDEGGDLQPPAVAVVTVTAPAATVEVGQTLQLTANASDAAGATLPDRAFGWTTSAAAVASVSSSGLVTGLSEGQAVISAVSEGVTGSVPISVTQVPPPPPPPPPPSATPGLQQIATGLATPLYLTSPPGDGRLFVVEKGGVIRVIKDGAVLDGPFLDITSQVRSTEGEAGLLGLAFLPDYATSGRFVVHYTDFSGASRISMFRASADPDRADPAESLVLEVTRPGRAHFGGQLLFGPDGMLYIGLGDGDDSDGGRGQSLSELLGSVLRIDVTSGTPYVVPPDNPFVANPDARPEIWSYGLRNPWRFSFDRANGDLYLSDVGESQWEEVNFASAAEGAGRGINYGWSLMEGRHCSQEGCDQTGITLPVLEYGHNDGCSITGGYVYRGTALPALQGKYFYSDFCTGFVRSIRMEGGVAVEQTDWPALEPGGLVTSFGEDAAGELYLLTRQGGVYKIVPK